MTVLEIIVLLVVGTFVLVVLGGVLRMALAAGHALFKTRKWREWNEQQQDR